MEFAVAIGAGIAVSSIALIGFGFDSAVEALAGFIIVWRFGMRRRDSATAERLAQQLVAVSFFILTAYVAVEAVRLQSSVGSATVKVWGFVARAAG